MVYVYTKNFILLILRLLEMTVYNLHLFASSEKFMKTIFYESYICQRKISVFYNSYIKYML